MHMLRLRGVIAFKEGTLAITLLSANFEMVRNIRKDEPLQYG